MAKPKDDGASGAVATADADQPPAFPPEHRDALQRFLARRQAPAAKVSRDERGKLQIGSDDEAETTAFYVQLGNALGTGSTAFLLRQLDRLASTIPDEAPAPQKILNSMLAAVDGFRPQNEAEAMLAVQMAATHEAAMSCLARLAHAETTAALDSMQGAANKLMRTFALQLEALAKMRRGGEQTVRVEHVHVYAGGQAVVGNVEHSRGGRIENGSQPHALTATAALALSDGGSLLRDDAERVSVSGTGGQRQGAVPDARRRKGKRRANG